MVYFLINLHRPSRFSKKMLTVMYEHLRSAVTLIMSFALLDGHGDTSSEVHTHRHTQNHLFNLSPSHSCCSAATDKTQWWLSCIYLTEAHHSMMEEIYTATKKKITSMEVIKGCVYVFVCLMSFHWSFPTCVLLPSHIF